MYTGMDVAIAGQLRISRVILHELHVRLAYGANNTKAKLVSRHRQLFLS